MAYCRPKTPKKVERQLRQEAGFGCVVCGNPIVEYHHIIPWSERNHFEHEHMVAVCRNHHNELHAQRKVHAYRAKANPINIRTGRVKGYLHTKKENQALVLGNTRFLDVTTAVSYSGNPLFGYHIRNSEIKVQVFVPNEYFWPSVEVIDNKLVALTDGFWDIEFKNNFVKFWQKKGENFLSIDFRKDDVEICGRFEIEGKKFVFSPKRSDFEGNSFGDITIRAPHGGPAISHGGQRRLLRPNFAMREPKPIWR